MSVTAQGSASPPPDLLIDAGNTRIKWALAKAGAPFLASGSVVPSSPQGGPGAARLDAPDTAVQALAADWAKLERPGGAWLSNVAGEAVGTWLATQIEMRWPGLAVHAIRTQPCQCGVRNGYSRPGELGTDRWAALIGARAAYPGENLLLATLGTATTLELLHADGLFSGGLIAPGWGLMMNALGTHTAQLPTLSPQAGSGPRSDQVDGPGRVHDYFATDTRTSIFQGCLLAQAALIERAWHAGRTALGEPVRCVVGGGAADALGSALSIPHTRRDHLVLSGLALIAQADAAGAPDTADTSKAS